eukprot:CAMPEP_0197942902 /NCGR_PEP_ID=MMETSP1439-20131203/124643_1 /TAXON_ID=66791 /ORGANISM="Gonyaulax spinifera, Strain CCMP409" /LENGTH=423 /DNA_ID=CAMNT_0043566159 /DNA_START=147 /DNA_END=1420 /DNA_ORIENTATION=-
MTESQERAVYRRMRRSVLLHAAVAGGADLQARRLTGSSSRDVMPLRERLGLHQYRDLYLGGPSDWRPDLDYKAYVIDELDSAELCPPEARGHSIRSRQDDRIAGARCLPQDEEISTSAAALAGGADLQARRLTGSSSRDVMPLRERLALHQHRDLYLWGPTDWRPDLAPTVYKAEACKGRAMDTQGSLAPACDYKAYVIDELDSAGRLAPASDYSGRVMDKPDATGRLAPASDYKGREMDKPDATGRLAPASDYKGRVMDKPDATGSLAPASDSKDTQPRKGVDSEDTQPRKGTVKERATGHKGRVMDKPDATGSLAPASDSKDTQPRKGVDSEDTQPRKGTVKERASAVKNSAMKLLTGTFTNAVQTSRRACSSRSDKKKAQTTPAEFASLMPSQAKPAWEDKAERGGRRRSRGGFGWTKVA